MKSKSLVVWVLVGMGLAMLFSVGFLGSEGSLSAQDSTDPVFVGAGDIASCNRTGDEATAKLLDNIVADAPLRTTVFTTGDNAYESGTAPEFKDCYEPNWGRHKVRTYPTVATTNTTLRRTPPATSATSALAASATTQVPKATTLTSWASGMWSP